MKQSLLLAGLLSVIAGNVWAAQPGKVSGTVTLDKNSSSGPIKVWMIQQDTKPGTEEVSIRAIDSAISTDGSYGFTIDAYTPGSSYTVKVALEQGHAAYGSYLPTYLGGAFVWHDARTLGEELFDNAATSDYNIKLQPLMEKGGPGSIGGRVVLGEQKGSGVGDPGQRVIILTNATTGQPVAATTSDVGGVFHFPNLPLEDYYLSGDEWNKTNPKLGIPITATQHNIMDIVFRENDKKFYGQIGNVGVGTHAALKGVRVFPVPATDMVSIAGLQEVSGTGTIVLRSMSGAQISEQATVKGLNTVSLQGVPAGLYMLELSTPEGTASYRVQK